ncbi:DUF58 domain-containing protein [Paenibacillus sp. FSL W8-0187]|uniref:DUF58 domain-containing protein n=1 Tax=Paenibacillus sp. FSL W8-0187 TaxID=2921710 RepID=UPI0030DAC0CE
MRRRLLEWSRGVAIWSVSLGLYVWLGGESLRLVWWASTILLLGGALTSLLGPNRITISHTSFPSCIQAGDSAQMTVQVTYRSLLPVPWLIITDRIGSREYRKLLFPGMKRRLEYTYRLNQVPRGVWSSIYSEVEWGDMFGWFRTSRSVESDTAGMIVLPRPSAWPEAQVPMHGSDMDMEDERVRFKVWNEMRGSGVRDYVPGDPMNRIHWKNSAKLGRLQSFMPHESYGSRQGVVLDTSLQGYAGLGALKPEDAFEDAVSAAAGFVSRLIRYKVPYQLCMDGDGMEDRRIEYKGVFKAQQDTLVPFASVQLTEKDPLRNRSFEKSLSPSQKNTDWAIITGVFHQGTAVAAINLLNAGSRKVTIFCTQSVKRLKPAGNSSSWVSPNSPMENQAQPEWAREFFSKGGRLVYLHEQPTEGKPMQIGGANHDRTGKLAR